MTVLASHRHHTTMAVVTVLGLIAGTTNAAIADVRVHAPDIATERPADAIAAFDEGMALLGASEWEQAGHVFTSLVEEHPDYAMAWYQLGYCHLMGGQHAGAAAAWERSAELGWLPAESRYNLACALALAGRSERALDALEASVELGYVDVEAMAKDADLASLRELARFQALVGREPRFVVVGGEPITFESAAEGRTVHGVLYPAPASPRESATFLLFHQAGSNYAEYAPIAPRLVEMGFNVLAIDALGGGASWGRLNETVKAHGARGTGADAIEDFRGALSFLDREGYRGPRVLWGSSYSVGRVLALLSEPREDVVAGVAFSGGRALARELEDGSALATRIRVPVFFSLPVWEYDLAWKARFDSVASEDKWLYVPTEGGAHGSSMLRPDRNPIGHEAAWAELTAFIDAFVPARQGS